MSAITEKPMTKTHGKNAFLTVKCQEVELIRDDKVIPS